MGSEMCIRDRPYANRAEMALRIAAAARASGIALGAIYGLVALGLVHPKRVKRNADAKVGDRLILGKPLGVGVLSAALKKDALSADGYAQMIASTTKLNTPGRTLSNLPGVHALSGDTDGVDGVEPIAGAVCGPDTLARAAALGLNAQRELEAHNAYGFFAPLGDLVSPGPTFTNVNDFRALLIE